MTPRIIHQIGLCFLLPAIVVLVFSIYRSSHGTASAGLSGLGTVLLIVGIVLRVHARRVAGS